MAPLYSFVCNQCETAFDSVERYSDMVLLRYPPCPKCGGKETRKDAGIAVGTYRINGDNSASTRPRGGGAFNKRKEK